MTNQVKINTVDGEPLKEWIFKEGVFGIEPTTNTCQKVGDFFQFTNENSQISIPYVKTGRRIFFEIVSSTVENTGFYYFNNGIKEVIAIFKSSDTFVIAINSSSIVKMNATNLPRNCQLKSIWTEAIL